MRNVNAEVLALLMLLVLLEKAVRPLDAADRSSIWFPRQRTTQVRPSVINAGSAISVAAQSSGRPVDTPLSQSQGIPLDFLVQLSDVRNVTYFINNFVDTNSFVDYVPADSSSDIENRFGPGDERKSAHSAKPALCEPQLEVVPLAIPTDPSLFYYPSCTRIERCGGCCGSTLLKCQPTETEIVNYKVIVTQFTGAKQMKFKGNEMFSLERHLECRCDCITKETDCNGFQEYRENECQCICMNKDEQQKCFAKSHIKTWDPTTCTCFCKEKKNCSTGSYFDEDTCRCSQIPKLRT